MEQLKYRVADGKLCIAIPTVNGEKVIQCATMQTPDGSNGVVYDCYVISLNRVMKNVTDIGYYVDKTTQVVNLMNRGESLQSVIKGLIESHVNQHGRIIDTDLMMIADCISQVLKTSNTSYDVNQLRLQCAGVAMNNFEDKFLITIYHRTPFGFQPRLVTAREFMKG